MSYVRAYLANYDSQSRSFAVHILFNFVPQQEQFCNSVSRGAHDCSIPLIALSGSIGSLKFKVHEDKL
jgi:hypothetical protein